MQSLSFYDPNGEVLGEDLMYPGGVMNWPNMGNVGKVELNGPNMTEIDSWQLKDGNNVVHEATSIQTHSVIFEDATGFVAPFGLYCGGVHFFTMAAE